MAKKEHISETQATQFLRQHGVPFTEHPYPYEEHGGTAVSARELGVPEHALRISWRRMDSYESPALMGRHYDSSVSIGSEVLDGQFACFCPYANSGNRQKKRHRNWLQR